MTLTLANETEAQKGWRVSNEFLKTVRQKVIEIELGDETPSLEQIEDVLVAYEQVKHYVKEGGYYARYKTR
ncbi:hypothetical protein [Kurthia gibsonii]|uniref:hypothetical protein n=1 Tax=Kurthia gibsonii TaxID=33946 RepID=UPI00301A6396